MRVLSQMRWLSYSGGLHNAGHWHVRDYSFVSLLSTITLKPLQDILLVAAHALLTRAVKHDQKV
jgi:hypothetical protein